MVSRKKKVAVVVKKWRTARLKAQIENLRMDLNESAMKNGLLSPVVLKKSVELDKVLNRYDFLCRMNRKVSKPLKIAGKKY
ncbi:aspartyl-phosphate phosphatase Spo0E family protein [Paenibacillus taichungensis]